MKFKFADLVSAMSPRAAASPSLTVPRRADRAAKPTSTGDAAGSRSTGTSKVGRPGNSSRFAHWAGVGQEEKVQAVAVEPDPYLLDVPTAYGMRGAAIRAAIVNNQGRMPGCETPEQAAAFIAASAAKVRGQAAPAAAPGVSTASIREAQARAAVRFEEGNTPEKAAAFIARSAAKAQGKAIPATAEGIADNAVALARRAGVIR